MTVNDTETGAAPAPDGPDLLTDFEAWVEQRDGEVVPIAPSVAVLPSEQFDAEDLPDVDGLPATVDTDEGRKVPVPMVWATRLNDGIHILAPEHVALMWTAASQEELLSEYLFRQEYSLDIPPIVRRAVESGLEEDP